MTDDGSSPEIRSFVRRGGRTTRAQRRALEAGWPRFGVEPAGSLDLGDLFGRAAPVVLEVGFGMGDALLAMADAEPARDYLGIDVHEAGIGRLLNGIIERDLRNVRVIRGDAMEVLERCIAPSALSAVLVYFPDPWPKARHHKRRLIRPSFVALVSSRLAPGGHFELATDWEDYAHHMMETIEREPSLANLAGAGRFAARPASRPRTRFEARGERLGHGVWDLRFERR